jgi:tRNA(Ile)-lysidine synthase
MLSSQVAQAIRRHDTLSPGGHVLVAVSGGPDSLALLSILRDLVPIFSFHLVVAHFDHGWREDSDSDTKFVAGIAQGWGYRCIIGRADPGLPQTEDAGRNARYAFLRESAQASGSSVIVVGHNQDDQIETLLLHLLRGSGSRGLGAMRRRNGDLARPLLDTSRTDIEAYLRERRLTPLRDPSNDDLRYARNRLRHTVLPALDAFDPASRRLLARAADILAEEDDLLNRQVDLLSPADPSLQGELHPALQRRLVLRQNPASTFAQVEAARRYGTEPPQPSADSGRPRLTVRACRCDPASFKARDQVGHLDADTLVLPLQLRTRRPGDRLQPLGFNHDKKLQDILVDAHVPRHLRDSLPLVEDQHGIVWIPGVTVAESKRVTSQTKEQLHLEIGAF